MRDRRDFCLYLFLLRVADWLPGLVISFFDISIIVRDKGFVVVKNAITEDKAASYVALANEWLEGFDLGCE